MSCSPNPGKERSRSRSPLKMRSPEPEPLIEEESTNLEPTKSTVPNELSDIVKLENNENTGLQKSIKNEFDDPFHDELLRLEESIKDETSMIDEVLNDEIDESSLPKKQKFNEAPFSKPTKNRVQSVIRICNLPKEWDHQEARDFLHQHTTLTPNNITVFIAVTKNRRMEIVKSEFDLRFFEIEDSLVIYKDLMKLKKTNDAFKNIIVIYKYPKHIRENIIDKNMTLPAPKVLLQGNLNFSPAYLPPEDLGDETYGLSLSYLNSLGIKPPLTCKVFVKNIDSLVDEAKLREVFELAGEVKAVNLLHFRAPRETVKARITYDHPVEAVQAIAMFNNQFLYNFQMKVTMDMFLYRKGRMLPAGLRGVGKGLGPSGLPLKGIRTIAELRPLKKMLQELTTNKTSTPPPATTPSNNPFGPNIKENNQNNVTNALNSLNPQSLLLGLLGAQGLFQQGNGNDLLSMLTNMQNQMIPNQFVQNTNPQYNMAQASASNVTPTPGIQNAFNIDSGWNKQNFNQNAAGLNQNAPGFNQNAPGYNQNASGDSQNVIGYNQNMTGYNQNATGYNPSATGFDQTVTHNRNEWTTTPGPETRQSRFGGEPVRYNSNPTNFDSKGNVDSSHGKDTKTATNGSSKTVNKFEKKETALSSDLLVFNNLPSSVTVQALNMKMREVGDLMFGEMTGQGRAIVRFKHSHDAERCIKLFNRSKVDGQIIDVHDALKRL